MGFQYISLEKSGVEIKKMTLQLEGGG